MMKLLLTNDDGIHAEGLARLQRVMERFGSIQTVAPQRPFSGCGHQITTDRPLHVDQTQAGRVAVDGSPADCVRLGLLYFLPDARWVVAGINAGGNLGVDIHMSGTVAAAREAALMGRPAIAISQYLARESRFDWDRAAELAGIAFEQLRETPLEEGLFWNVNLPDWKGERREPELIICDPDAHPLAIDYQRDGDHFRYRGIYQNRRFAAGTDVDYCFQGYLTASKVSSNVGTRSPAPDASSSSRRAI
jgi:5'-nucleotidase